MEPEVAIGSETLVYAVAPVNGNYVAVVLNGMRKANVRNVAYLRETETKNKGELRWSLRKR